MFQNDGFSLPKNFQAKKNDSTVRLDDVVVSTSAAPSYFPFNKFEADGKEHFLVDGGLAANNPVRIFNLQNLFFHSLV